MRYAGYSGWMRLFGWWSVWLLGLAGPGSVSANTVVPPRHLGELATISDAVVLARAGGASVVVRGDLILTRTAFTVLEGVRGPVGPQDVLAVETFGGVAGGVGWTVAGSPRFEEGVVYLLFLSRTAGDEWQPRLMAYGLLERAEAPDGTALLTHVAEHHDLNLLRRPDGVTPEPVGTYGERALLRHLRDVVAARTTWNPAAAAVPEAWHPATHQGAGKRQEEIPAPCEYLSYSGDPIRWQTFDAGGDVAVYAEEAGDLEVDGDAEFAALEDGLATWQAIPGITTNLVFAGTAAYTPDCSDDSAAPGDIAADQALIQYNDPCDQLPDLSSCIGTLALGGSFFLVDPGSQHLYRGLAWNTSVVGYIIVNNGVGPCISADQYRIVMAHELGHVLGFDHIPLGVGPALMNPSCCVDRTVIDETCALFAYSEVAFPTAPAQVALLEPEHRAENVAQPVTLDWEALDLADTYRVQVSLDNDFTDLVVDDSTLTRSSTTLGPLFSGTLHYWRVRAENTLGIGPWSLVYRFTTAPASAPPGATTPAAPDDEAVDLPRPVTFAWAAAAQADVYHLQVSPDDAFTPLTYEDEEVRATSRVVDVLAGDARYYWRVRARNSVGDGPWSAPRSLLTRPDPPGVVMLDVPLDDAERQPMLLAFAWAADPWAATYQLQVSTDKAFTALVVDDETLAEPAAQFLLRHNTTYYWRVRALNRIGVGAWSEERRFKTAVVAPDPIVLSLPEDAAGGLDVPVAFAWEPGDRAAIYQLEVSTTDDFADVAYRAAVLTEPSAEVAELAERTTYFWRVRAVNAAGSSPWSAVRRFTTTLARPAAVALLAPADDAADLPGIVTFAWEALDLADTYHLQVSTTDDFAAPVVDADGLTETTWDAGPLAYSTRHAWRVRAVNAAGAGSWSPVRHFTVAVGTGVAGATDDVPVAYRLHPNYPNPFPATTTLRFDLPETAEVSLVVYDVLGRVVETLIAHPLPAGRHTVAWDAETQPSGIYLARFRAGSFLQTQRLMVVR